MCFLLGPFTIFGNSSLWDLSCSQYLHSIPLHSLPSRKSQFSFEAAPSLRARTRKCAQEMARNCNVILWEIVLFLVIFFFQNFASSYQSDYEALRRFRQSIRIKTDDLLSWEVSTSPCNGDQEIWHGVMCENGTVWGLKLENMGLSGIIDVDALGEMRELRSISFMHNNFDGPLPQFSKLGALKSLYLSYNRFSDELTTGTFGTMLWLKKLYLANNNFKGTLPPSLRGLPRLIELSLENNRFEGGIPAFEKGRLKYFNASNNNFIGEIPPGLSEFDISSFSGNPDLCGPPLKPCDAPDAYLSFYTISFVGIAVAAALAALVAVMLILCRRKQIPKQLDTASANTPGQRKANLPDADLMEQGQATLALGSSSPECLDPQKKAELPGVKLTFLRDDKGTFDMTDLLKASAEVLGSGEVGSTYKAVLGDGRVMVVKRFKHMNNLSKEEFHDHMRRLGRLKHPNVLPIVAFYYRKEEKLLVTEFAANVSLAVHLHANRSRPNPPLDWPTRLNIMKGVASGLKYLYDELPSITAPHGHLKSSNVLLDGSYNAVIMDYGLVPVVNQEHAEEHMISYKSPEYKKNGRITKKTDIWGLGILILEVLTGRFPSNFLQKGKGSDTDLTKWVESVMHDDEGGGDVFDKNIVGSKNSEGEMMKLLKIGLSCCANEVESRPDIKEVVAKIEEVKEMDDDFYSSYTSETDRRSSRGLSEDFN